MSLKSLFPTVSILLLLLLPLFAQESPKATPAPPGAVNIQPAPTVTTSSPTAAPINAPGVAPGSSGAAPNVPSASQEASQQEIVIGSGDLLVVAVDGAPEYRYEVRVNPNGQISLPMAGGVRVAGLQVPQAEEAIANKLKEKGIFNDPQVSVFAKELATQGISVLGEVQKPGNYPLMGPHTLLDAISAAGGVTPKAGQTAAIVHRDRPGQPEFVKLDRNSDGQLMSDARIRPGDTVVVSKAGMVYVVGDVREPAGIIMDNAHLTVLQALAMSKGANPTAALGSAKLIRKGANGPIEQPVDLSKIMSAKSPDVALQPDDILFVPGSAAKSATRRGLEAIMQAATGVAVYRKY